MIQEYLATRVRDTSESLYEIQNRTGIKTSSLSSLIRDKKASIKTCEKLIEYFSISVESILSEYSLLYAVRYSIERSDLSKPAGKFLLAQFKTSYKFLQQEGGALNGK